MARMTIITCQEIEDILEQWRDGRLTENAVHAWAGARYSVAGEYEPETHACNAVLAELDMMNINLISTTEIPILLRAMHSRDYEDVLTTLYDHEDIATRETRLRDNPFYAPFCGAPQVD